MYHLESGSEASNNLFNHLRNESSSVTVDSVTEFLNQGADVNWHTRGYKETPLMVAAYIKNPAITNLLLEYGATVNQPDHIGSTALHSAASSNNLDVMHSLITAGADVNKVDQDQRTPIDIALRNQYFDAADRLHYAGATLDTPDIRGDTFLLRLEKEDTVRRGGMLTPFCDKESFSNIWKKAVTLGADPKAHDSDIKTAKDILKNGTHMQKECLKAVTGRHIGGFSLGGGS